ncbi:hypothetical protein H9645_03705 [Luteimonas sp. Sa2BVA3]|uniref:Uncharacterized protein n=1 Tax=Luteimonas colneyensis TaxID=2762230 RepID=A0ABR8UGI0_9GAMM|nr:hypothetical protein [Luteimonas colneyensis]MBD7987127.1 hypothetical protein [Luteimonas colneyensis]
MATWAGPRRVTHAPPKPASMRGMAAALAVLSAPVTEQGSDALLAERERLAREAEATARRQGELRLGTSAS